MKVLKDHIHLSTRYSRSIQLERDIDALDITEGYIPTPRSLSALRRVQDSLLEPGMARAFTITAVYGTGKSAFAQFLATLLGGRDENRKIARSVLHASLHRSSGPTSIATTNEKIKIPFAIGVVAASREPLVFTMLAALRSALERGVGFESQRIPALVKECAETQKAIRTSHDSLDRFHSLLTEITRATEGGLVLILDEFGKNLEYAVQNSATAGSDIYLLQQLAELREIEGKPVGLITLLHQSFTEYGDDLTREQRAEWAKIQGRFEDLPLQESELNALPLLAAAMRHDKEIVPALKQRASVWHKAFQKLSGELPSFASLSERILAGLLPLHPVTARLLPALSARYAQNERSVFTFLTGPEGLAFPQFLSESNVADLPTFRPARLFDYFSESMGSTISMQAGYSRFLEVQDIIKDAQFLPPLHLEILKTIGTLNLLSTSGDLRAGKELVILSAMNDPDDAALRKEIVVALEELKKKGLVHYRAGADEFRLWHGTLFDVDEGIKKERARGNLATSAILNEKFPFAPVVAQRHSFQTGTLRYFFRIFWDGTTQPFSELKDALEEEKMCDGFVVYSLNPEKEIHNENNFYLADGRPVVLITSKDVGKLNHELEHYASLVRLAEENVDLRRDKLALREVNARLRISEEAIHSLLAKVYDLASRGVEANMFFLFDKQEALSDLDKKSKAKNGNDKNTRKYIEKRGLGALLSYVCDAAYNLNYNKPGKNKQFHYSLKNELINRREIGSGISKAIRLLAEAMLKNPQAENFGLEGNGPEVTI
ncbi:MAG: hypothetical protein KDK41_14040, partial [Leptospiraceae bacterium]|nr:hypothetical protein [Leptospiraceae bacterium]